MMLILGQRISLMLFFSQMTTHSLTHTPTHEERDYVMLLNLSSFRRRSSAEPFNPSDDSGLITAR